ncbi:similar to Saccharomyces cerevisiae YKL163W PIR3 O-glycosylated covalently-bound cell wall protein required for cell wall stability [Maudiozyma saulgeensis]|uniref:Similar to Saccharomyces cerevisiae YKL163W PIR3 O-glycosylated covalently-bound cell wall protein required for cell wall stability n=1 Tax=Maudiozyma saulgeensis TaxID=1789683 RepID=A0A1X7R1E6_9SACH|nr:similar to Saccharomyces cerevisiae YKL163W PIR3 O-glycosylated covalently-bound cell wall protein required for cell wall stability [Kazachstania saulgeensis]
MQFKYCFTSLTFVTTVLAAYVPPEPWSTLIPTATYTGGLSYYTTSFGIAIASVNPIHVPYSHHKRDIVSQIGDGQAQVRHVTKVAAISQINDGQAQAPRHTIAIVSQINDGQAQVAKPISVVSQIGDGQIQVPTHVPTTIATRTAVSQIGDGQAQIATKAVYDGVGIATGKLFSSSNPVRNVACKSKGTLAMTIKHGFLTDSKGRIGSIVSNRQFQFDGPPPQAGAIYAGGWSITPEGHLALGNQDIFYQCLSGDFYNLYDKSIASQCGPVYLQAVDLIDC